MFDISDPFMPLLIVCGLAFIIPFVASRFPYFELPVIVLEILAGIVIGNSGFGIITLSEATLPQALMADQWLDFLAMFGFAFLMFLSGLEIDFTLIKTTKIIFDKDKFLPSI